jgi:hypothetical protein
VRTSQDAKRTPLQRADGIAGIQEISRATVLLYNTFATNGRAVLNDTWRYPQMARHSESWLKSQLKSARGLMKCSGLLILLIFTETRAWLRWLVGQQCRYWAVRDAMRSVIIQRSYRRHIMHRLDKARLKMLGLQAEVVSVQDEMDRLKHLGVRA